jgi:hypothetical protein
MKLLKKNWLLVLSIILNLILIYQLFSTEKNNVFPLEANKLKSFELGEAIQLLLPPDNSDEISWSYLSNSAAIFWLDETTNSNHGSDDNYNTRTGLMRINVKGLMSTILKRTNFELAWGIQLISEGNERFGPSSLIIGPGGSHEKIEEYLCFGTFAENCEFSPIDSLKSSSIIIEELCENNGSITIKAFYLSAKNKRKTLARVITQGGSGGTYTTMELFLKKTDKNVCEDDSL